MLYYRAFLIDPAGHVFAGRMLNSLTSASAVRLAEKLSTPCNLIEVWYGPHKIADVVPRNTIDHLSLSRVRGDSRFPPRVRRLQLAQSDTACPTISAPT